ncbi:MAG: YkgJ family cysteine cluster protein [Acidobacteriota bacterium]|nr:YkgJ family cysteine cluster protein [Acidobacteriota bacterium]
MKGSRPVRRRGVLPTLLAAAPDPPCERCAALCCRYFALELDPPEDEDDFDDLRWYLLHKRSWIWVDDGEWYLQVDEECRFLEKDGRCGIYDRRPRICREYGADPTDDPRCDYFSESEEHDMEFRHPGELET